jgi:glutathione S-transferase
LFLSLLTGEHFKEEFTKLNPWQRVPVLDDNGFVLTERYDQLFRNYILGKGH